jgi:hypothetical protein
MKGIKVIFSVLCGFAFIGLVNAQASSKDVAGMPSGRILEQQDPLYFARSFVNHVQGGASKEVYESFLHPKALNSMQSRPEMATVLYRNALAENAAIADSSLLGQPDVQVEVEGESATIQYVVDEEMSFKKVYPHSPFGGDTWVIQGGQILLEKHNGSWRVVGHAMNSMDLQS